MLLPYRDQKTQRRRWLRGTAAIALLGVMLVSLPLGDGLATLSYDVPFLFRAPVADTNVAVILEDRASLDALGEMSWPPSRTVHARLVDRLREEGAKLIVFDIVFRNERPGEDAVFAAAIKRHGLVILGGIPEVSTHQLADGAGAQLAELKPPVETLRTNAAAWGLLLVGNLDARFGVRKMTTAWHGRETVVWLAAVRSGTLPAAERADAERWISFFGAPPAVDRVTLGEVLETEGRRLAPGFLRGRIVFVGFDPSVTPASGARDLFATPYTRFGHDFSPGVEVLANACANLIRGDWLRRMSTPLQCLLAAIFTLAASALFIWAEPRRLVPTAAILFALLLPALFIVQWHTGVWWNWLVPVAVQVPLAALFSLACPRLPQLAFISYRREGGDKFATAIRSELRARGYEAFLDVTGLTAGEFPAQLRREIERAPNFILVLSPGALDERMAREDDWLRREISHAFTRNKKVIPILIDGFQFCSAATLPPELARLPQCQCITHQHDKWDATIDKLEKFLLVRTRRARAE